MSFFECSVQVVAISSRGWWVAVVYMWYAAMSWLHTAEGMADIDIGGRIIEGARDQRSTMPSCQGKKSRKEGKERFDREGMEALL